MPGPLKQPGIASLTHTLDRPPLLLAAHSPALTAFSIIVWLSSPRNSSTISSISVSSGLLVSSVQSSMRSMISSGFAFNSARLCSRVFFYGFYLYLKWKSFRPILSHSCHQTGMHTIRKEHLKTNSELSIKFVKVRFRSYPLRKVYQKIGSGKNSPIFQHPQKLNIRT